MDHTGAAMRPAGMFARIGGRVAGVLLFTLFTVLSGGLAYADVMLARASWFQYRASSFPTASGIVTRSEIEVHHGSKGGVGYEPRIEYDYAVHGVTYHGTRYVETTGGFTSSVGSPGYDEARLAVAGFPVGGPAGVRYDPSDPARAVLRPGLRTADLFLAIFFTPFNLIVFGIWGGMAWGLVRRLGFAPPAGCFVMIERERIVLRLAPYNVAVAACAGVGIASLAMMIVLSVAFGGAPSWPVAWVAVGVVVASGVWGGVRGRRGLLSGRYDLAIDYAAGEVTFPGSPLVRVPIALAAVRSVMLRTHEVPGLRGRTGTETWVVAEVWGHPTAERIVQVYGRRAPHVRGWLAGLLTTGKPEFSGDLVAGTPPRPPAPTPV